VLDHLPEGLRPLIGRQLDAAWGKADPEAAERALRALAASLEEAHPGAAASIREGLGETLTISRLDLSPALVRTFKSTNPIESLNDGIRVVQRNVKRWRSGTMALRWTAAAVLEREKRFRRVNGYRDLWLLGRALDRHTKEVTSSTSAA
jgi:transposase-like protein